MQRDRLPSPDRTTPGAAGDLGVRDLDLSMLGPQDLLNLALQRSEVLHDVPRAGQMIRAWTEGDAAPLMAAVTALGPEIAFRAAAVIRAEYLTVRAALGPRPVRRVADIGCGYAFFDLFLARETEAEVLLIDLETNGQRHFGFAGEGAAYSSLAAARAMLLANGVAPGRIRTLNPALEAPEDAGPVDLVVSFLACGFHFPVDAYVPFLRRALEPGGLAVFDLRLHSAARQAARLAALGTLRDLPAPPKARRILLERPAA